MAIYVHSVEQSILIESIVVRLSAYMDYLVIGDDI